MGFEGEEVASSDSGGGGRSEMCCRRKRTMGPGEFGEGEERSANAEMGSERVVKARGWRLGEHYIL